MAEDRVTPEDARRIFFHSEARPHGLRLSTSALFDDAASKLLAGIRAATGEDDKDWTPRARYLGYWAEKLQHDKVRYV